LRLDLEGKADESEKKLERLRKQYEVEFEKNSYVVNSQIDWLVSNVSDWIGGEPVSVTDRVSDVVAAYEKEKAGMSQEQRNEIYFELKRHYDFLTKVYNPKG